jgi:anti-sigma-K factor RskA
MTWVAGVAAAAIIGLGVWNITLQQQGHNHTLPASVADALAHGARSWPVAGTSIDPSVTGSLIQPRHHGNALLVLDGLPQTPSNKVYQVWLIRGTTPTSAGTFSVSSSGTHVFDLIHPATGYQLTAMTVEPAPHGSTGPTTKPILFGKLGA